MKRTVFFLLICFWTVLNVSGAELKIPFQKNKPVIDGTGNDVCWQGLNWNSGFTKCGTKMPAAAQTRFKVFHDGLWLYLLIEADEPDMARIKALPCGRDSNLVWNNDSVEISLVKDPQFLTFYKYVIDSNGAVSDLKAIDDNTNSDRFNVDRLWNAPAEVRTSKGSNKWLIEAALPFGAMDFQAEDNTVWHFNVSRSRFAGRKEFSSWSVIPVSSLMYPKSFNRVEFTGFDPKKFFFEIEKFRYSFVRGKDGRCVLTGTATIHNRTGSFKLLNLRLSQRTKPERTASALHEIQPRKYRTCSVVLHDALPGEQTVSLSLYSNNSVPVLLKQHYQKIDLEYRSLSVKLKRPCYRNNIYATMPDKTIEAVIELKEGVGNPVTVELTGKDFRETRTIGKSSAVNTVVFDGAKLKDGDYFLSASSLYQGRKLTDKVRIRKLPYLDGEVWLDAKGITYVNGKKFLPYGWTQGHGKVYPWMSSYETHQLFSTPAQARRTLAIQLKSGLRTILDPFQDMNPKGWVAPVIFKRPEAFRKGLTPKQKECIRKFISEVYTQPGLLGWYMADEPEGRDLNPLWYEEAYAMIREIDPYHPCIMQNYGIEGIRRYYKGGDILMPDCYPQYFEDGTTGLRRWCSSDWASAASALRPAWQMPLMTLWPCGTMQKKGVPADYHDQRSQVFQAFIHNVKGIHLYAWHDSQKYSEFIFGPEAIGETLMLLKDYLLENSIPDGITAKTTPAFRFFQAGLKEYQGKLCAVAVNTSTKKLRAEFRLNRKFSGKLHVAGENRSVNVKNGVFADVFEPKVTHIYLTDAKLAGKVPNVQATVQQIAKHKADRKKPGNLVGVGQLLDIHYRNFFKGKDIPADFPRIKASSDWTFYTSREFGSLYFLFDGLTEIRRPDYSWSPRQEDRKPWIEVTLPKRSLVRQIKLYTPNANLTDCRITLDSGRSFMVQGNKNNVITINIPGETTQKIRFDFTKYKKLSRTLNGLLLTEIEVF